MRSYCWDNTLDNRINGFGLPTEQFYKLQSLSNSKNFWGYKFRQALFGMQTHVLRLYLRCQYSMMPLLNYFKSIWEWHQFLKSRSYDRQERDNRWKELRWFLILRGDLKVVRSGIRTHAHIRGPERPCTTIDCSKHFQLESGALDHSAILTTCQISQPKWPKIYCLPWINLTQSFCLGAQV